MDSEARSTRGRVGKRLWGIVPGAVVVVLAACGDHSEPMSPGNGTPEARLEASPGYVQAGDSYETVVVLDASGSSDPDDDVLTYDWALDGGRPLDDPGPSVDVIEATFSGSSPATVVVTVRDGSGGSDTASAVVDVNRPPVALFSVTPPTIPPGDDHSTVLTLDGTASTDPDDDPVSFSWDVPTARFVEGTTADGARARITLPGDAAVSAVLTVTDARGGRDVDSVRVDLSVGASVTFRAVVSGLDQPVYLAAPEGDPRLFVVEKTGRIRLVREGGVEPTPFLDLSTSVSGGGERGLLSVAFHPEYATNGRFFVNYTDLEGATVVERYTVSSNPDVADPSSALRILRIEQPFSNHNGGQLQFGPDGMLYVGMGDGGSAGDPGDRAQDLSTLLGKLLRVDVDGGDPYVIPEDNPFVGQAGARGEIWALGLRNPWRFSFDPPEGSLYVADVGQNAWEEVNAVSAQEAGVNYGWRRLEGRSCFEAGCSAEGTTLPVLVYGHDEGCSVTGGYVYRGDLIPELRGHYFYADFCAGWVRSFRLTHGEATERTEWLSGGETITSFGLDGEGELYVVTFGGTAYRMEPS